MCEKKPCGSSGGQCGPWAFFLHRFHILYSFFVYCFIVKYALVNCIINKYRTENIKSPFRKLFNNKRRCLLSLFNFPSFGPCDVLDKYIGIIKSAIEANKYAYTLEDLLENRRAC